MRPSAIRRAMTSRVKAIQPRGYKTRRDAFQHVNRRPDPGQGAFPDRSFLASLSSQPRSHASYGTDDLKTVGYILQFFYNESDTVEDVIADDMALVEPVLDGLFRDEADIQETTITPLGVSDTIVGMVTVSFSCTFLYRHTFEG